MAKKLKAMFADGLENLLSGLGTGKDKNSHTRYVDNMVDVQELVDAYSSAWLPRKVVDLPAQDATRQWRTWANDAKAARDIERRIGLVQKTNEALKAARLYGGAAIFIDTGSKTPGNRISKGERIKRLIVLTANQVAWPAAGNIDPLNPGDHTFTVSGRPVHASRLSLFFGATVPGRSGWGDSVLKAPFDAIQDADGIFSNVASLVWEAKVDVFKIENMMRGLSTDPNYEAQLMKRLAIAQKGKSNLNALVLDKSEEYEQKKFNFGDLANLVMTGYQIAAGATQIPVTRLIGQSASGMNSTGDNEIRDYYDTVRGVQTGEVTPAIEQIDTMIAAEAGIPVDFEWNSLWQLSPQEAAEVLQKNANSIKTLGDTALFSDDVLYQPAIDLLSQQMPGVDNDVDVDVDENSEYENRRASF